MRASLKPGEMEIILNKSDVQNLDPEKQSFVEGIIEVHYVSPVLQKDLQISIGNMSKKNSTYVELSMSPKVLTPARIPFVSLYMVKISPDGYSLLQQSNGKIPPVLHALLGSITVYQESEKI